MSLGFGSLMGDFEDDPIFGSHMRSMRHMNNMMNSLFSDPFGMMGPPALAGPPHRGGGRHNEMQMMPFGFPPVPSFNMNRLFTDFDNMGPGNGNNCHSFSSSSVMAMTSGPDGRPQVYQASSSMRTAPGGVKETKKTISDSRTGTKKMAIGHHIGERAHILEREHNIRNGEQEERQEFINLEEEEADDFNKEWETRTRRSVGAINAANYGNRGVPRSRGRPEHNQLALPAPTSSRPSSRSKWAPAPRRGIRVLPSSKISGITSTSRTAPSKSATTAPATTTAIPTSTTSPTSGSRKRDHTPDSETSNKRHAKPNTED